MEINGFGKINLNVEIEKLEARRKTNKRVLYNQFVRA